MKIKTSFAVLLPLLVLGPLFAEQQNDTIATKTQAVDTSDANAGAKTSRRTAGALPAGWFKTKTVAGRRRGESVEPVAHFDTPGTGPTSRRSVAERLQSAKSAQIYSIPNPRPAVPLNVPTTTQTTVSVSQQTAPANIPAPVDAIVDKASPAVLDAAPHDLLDAIPGAPLETEANDLNSIVVDQDVSVDTFAPQRLDADEVDSTLIKSDIAIPGELEVADVMGEAADFQPNSESLFTPPPAAQPQAASVVTKSSIRHEATQNEASIERMQLSPIDDQEASSSPQLAATPMEHGFSSTDGEESVEPGESDVLISNQNPVIMVQTRGPRTIVVGKPATYSLVVTNDSDNNAKDVIVNVRIPTWTEVQSQDATVGAARMTPDDQGNTIMRWSVGSLAAHGKEMLKLQIVPRSSRPFDLGVTWVFNPARTRAQIQVQEPKLDLTVVGPADVLYGEKKVYTLTVSNPGTGDAENVVLQLLPFVPNEDPAVRELGVLKAGERRTLEVELKARQTGRLHIRAEANAANGLRAHGQQEVFVRRASIQVKAEAPEMKYAGSRATFRIRVSNSGDAMARDVIAVASLPTGAEDVEVKSNGIVKNDRSEIHWELGALRPGAVRVLEFECTLTEAGTNRVDVRSVAGDNLSAVTSAQTTVESLADLKLTVDDPKGAIATGTEVTYEVRVQNRGTKDAKNISMIGYFSEGIEPTAINGWTGKVKEGQVEMDQINRLGPGQELTIKITATANRPGNHVFRAEVTCNNPETRLASEEWTRFYGDGVRVLNASSKPASSRR
ncbi:MAG: hypothetical protein KDB27_15340 [Planctomycetales bacterium]|nr:hypothetical protein [Planctomycetales bacterium]